MNELIVWRPKDWEHAETENTYPMETSSFLVLGYVNTLMDWTYLRSKPKI